MLKLKMNGVEAMCMNMVLRLQSMGARHSRIATQGA